MKTTSTVTTNKTTATALDQKAIAGIQKYFASMKSIVLGGTTYTPATLKAAFQAEVDAIAALDTAKAQLKQHVADTTETRENTQALRSLLGSYLLASNGAGDVQMLADFGLNTPKSRGPRTAEAKAQAQAKARTTREAKKAALKNASASLAAGPATPPVVATAASVSLPPAKTP